MSAAWLFLYLGTLVHLLALWGYGLKSPAAWVVLLPLALLAVGSALRTRLPILFGPTLLRVAGVLAFACALFLAKELHLSAWDSQAWRPNLLMAGAGLGSLWVALGTPDDSEGMAPWLWVAFWMGTAFLDPALPLLGAGLSAMLHGSNLLGSRGESAPPEAGSLGHPRWSFFLLGLALPKPWWDFALSPEGAWGGLAFGLGAALMHLAPMNRLAPKLPKSLGLWGPGLLAVAYHPALLWPWGLLLGACAGLAWRRLPRPVAIPALGWAFLGGLLISFTLHANAWIPGLRHLIWLGN